MSEDNIEIGDVENYLGNKDTGFSHQSLVMKSMSKVLDVGSKEMKAGWIDYKIDKNGNSIKTYIEDSRLVFISAVETCLMIMECDLDETSQEELKKFFDKKKEISEYLKDCEVKEWEQLNPMIKQRLLNEGKGIIKGFLNKDKRFYQIYLDELVNIYREIFKTLTKQTKRLDFYSSEIVEG